MVWLTENLHLILPLLAGFLAVLLLLPVGGRRPMFAVAVLLGSGGLLLAGMTLVTPTGKAMQDVLFYVFAGMAVVSGVCMISQQNPVYAALWFSLVILSTCGLFLLQSAPFLAAATVIVYAGAIIVTFLFVIMLAQQTGLATYDRRSREPLLATLGGFLLLGALLYTLQATYVPDETTGAPTASPGMLLQTMQVAENRSKLSDNTPTSGQVADLGQSLFGDYLYAVELAGTLLLIATIGAIAISARRTEVLR